VSDTKRHNVGGRDPKHFRCEVRHNLRATGRFGLHCPAYLDETWLPGRQDIVDHEGDSPVAQRVTILLGRGEIMATDIDRIVLVLVPTPYRDDMEVALGLNRCQAAEPLALQIGDFLRGKSAHVLSPSCGADTSRSNEFGWSSQTVNSNPSSMHLTSQLVADQLSGRNPPFTESGC